VERVALEGLAFSRKARLNQVVALITPQLRLIRMLRGLTRGIPSFDDGDFDEVRYERHLDVPPDLVMARCWYWIRKLQACLWADEPTASSRLDSTLPAASTRSNGHTCEIPTLHTYAGERPAKPA
jgi:hypothetical protein